MTRPNHHDPNAQDMKPWKRYYFHKFTMSSCCGKDVTEMQSLDTILDWPNCFLNTFTCLFDEVCVNDELQTKKIIKFRLGGRAYSLTLLEFARRLGLYQANYWLSISREDNLSMSRSHTSTIRRPILRVIHKMITYSLCQRTTGLGDCKMDEEERSWDSGRESNLLWMGRMEIRQDAIERMKYRQSYHWDRYQGVFEHMAKVYSVPLHGAYNLPGYAQP
ncbi:hypothetical protein Tco_0778067 [Tanacetum coccineum]